MKSLTAIILICLAPLPVGGVFAKVANTNCPITLLILQNEPNFLRFCFKNHDLAKKRTQNEPKRTQFFGFIGCFTKSMKSAKSASKNHENLCNLWPFLCKTNPILSAVADSMSLCDKYLRKIYIFVESQFKANSNPIKPNQSQAWAIYNDYISEIKTDLMTRIAKTQMSLSPNPACTG
jgi:hypothetical protein